MQHRGISFYPAFLALAALALAPIQQGLALTRSAIPTQTFPAANHILQPDRLDPGVHGGYPNTTTSCDITTDGRLALASRLTREDGLGFRVTWCAMALDPSKIQSDANGNLSGFLNSPNIAPQAPNLSHGDNFAFSNYLDAYDIWELPNPQNFLQTDDPNGAANKPFGFLSATNAALPISLFLRELPTQSEPFGSNPYPADRFGNYDATGTYLQYKLSMITTDYHWVWVPASGPNGGFWTEDNSTHPPVLGSLPIDVLMDISGTPEIAEVAAGQFTPFTIESTSENIFGIEPTITADGRLLVYHADGGVNAPSSPSNLWGKSTYIFNQTPNNPAGWSHPRSISSMYYLETDATSPHYNPTQVGSTPSTSGGTTPVYFRDIYGLAQHPLRESHGKQYAYGEAFSAPYPWVSREGDFLAAQHSLANPSGSSSNGATRSGTMLVGTITQGYVKHIDHPAINPTREGDNVEWPIAGGFYANVSSERLFLTSPGLQPGPWVMAREDDVPVPSTPFSATKPVLPLFSVTSDNYGEVALEEMDGAYLLYLACNEAYKEAASGASFRNELDPTRTPDTSGLTPRAKPHLESGASFPQEYAGSSAAVRIATGNVLGATTADENLGFKGQAIMFPSGGQVRVEDAGWNSTSMTAEAFVKLLPNWNSGGAVRLIADPGRFTVALRPTGQILVRVTTDTGVHSVATVETLSSVATPWDRTEGWHHVAFTFEGPPAGSIGSKVVIWVDGVPVKTKIFLANSLASPASPRPDVLVGPGKSGGSTDPTQAGILMDEIAISSIARNETEMRRAAYVEPLPSGFGPAPTQLALPFGLDGEDVLWPVTDNYNADIIQLGNQLFNSKILSGTGTSSPNWGEVSCSTCHESGHGFAEDQPLASAFGGGHLAFNSPTILNTGFSSKKFFDGRVNSLEEQPQQAIESSIEMNLPMSEALARLSNTQNLNPQGIPWASAFLNAFSEPVSEDNLSKALSMYMRTLNSGNAPEDRFGALLTSKPGGFDQLTNEQKRGRAIFFGKARCSSCHTDSMFADGDFHNIGSVSVQSGILGRGGVSAKEVELGAVKTPTLRNVGLSKPYMHDGQVDSLLQVVEHYNRGGFREDALPSLGERSWLLRPLLLESGELADLAAYLNALTGSTP